MNCGYVGLGEMILLGDTGWIHYENNSAIMYDT